MKASIHGLFEKLKAGKPIASHEGDITSEIIEEFLTKVENSLSDAGESPKKIRKVYNILVEALQNLYHHQAVPPAAFIKEMGLTSGAYSFCTIIKGDNGTYKVTTGNFVTEATAKSLKERIEQLNSLSQEELKSLYKIVLDNDEFSEKGGGGLGFIEMARKSGNKFGYEFAPYDEKYKFFVLEIFVS